MAYLPLATQIDLVYTLTGPDGSVAVFNDPASADYVGMLTEVTGLDSAEVRESANDLTEADGGAHGAFFLGRRPITLSGRVFGHTTAAARNIRLDRARRASMALRGDAVLRWTPSGGVSVFVSVRRQGPFRESGGWVKDFQIPLVAESAFIVSSALKTVANGVAAENQGNMPAYPIISFTGAGTNPSITDSANVLRTTGLTLAAGEVVEFDTLKHTGAFTAGARNGQSANRYIDWATTGWPYVRPLSVLTTFTLAGAASASIRFRDTWA